MLAIGVKMACNGPTQRLRPPMICRQKQVRNGGDYFFCVCLCARGSGQGSLGGPTPPASLCGHSLHTSGPSGLHVCVSCQTGGRTTVDLHFLCYLRMKPHACMEIADFLSCLKGVQWIPGRPPTFLQEGGHLAFCSLLL